MQSELHNMSCYCYQATDGWSIRRFLIVTNDKAKAVAFMEDLCRRFTDENEKWTYEKSNFTNSFGLNAKVIL